MDNLTHTLVGAALAEAGLKRRTALASATLMIGANFPDIDVVAVPLDHGIEWRRGAPPRAGGGGGAPARAPGRPPPPPPPAGGSCWGGAGGGAPPRGAPPPCRAS